VFEAGHGVGGTWYWNAIPGRRFDSESWTYGYSFSDEILREWEWSEHFAAQPETLRYCNFVADKLDLRRDIEFNRRIRAVTYDEAANQWDIESEEGRRERARFLITALGPCRRRRCRPSRASRPSAVSPTIPHLAARAGRLREQACGGDRHRGDGRAGDHRRSPRPSATSPSSSAPRTGARRCTTARWTRPTQARIKANLSGDLRGLPRSPSAVSSTKPTRATRSR